MLGRADRAVPPTSVAPGKGKNIQEKRKEKNTSTASDIPLGNSRNGLLVPLTDFIAVVGEIGQW